VIQSQIDFLVVSLILKNVLIVVFIPFTNYFYLKQVEFVIFIFNDVVLVSSLVQRSQIQQVFFGLFGLVNAHNDGVDLLGLFVVGLDEDDAAFIEHRQQVFGVMDDCPLCSLFDLNVEFQILPVVDFRGNVEVPETLFLLLHFLLDCGHGCFPLVLQERLLDDQLGFVAFLFHHLQNGAVADLERTVEGFTLSTHHVFDEFLLLGSGSHDHGASAVILASAACAARHLDEFTSRNGAPDAAIELLQFCEDYGLSRHVDPHRESFSGE